MTITFPKTVRATITDKEGWIRTADGWDKETALFFLARKLVQEDHMTDPAVDETLLQFGVSFEELKATPQTVLKILINLQQEENDRYGTCTPEEAGSLGFDFQTWINNHLDIELSKNVEDLVIALITLQNEIQNEIDEILGGL